MSSDLRPIAEALVRHLASAPSAELVDATRNNLTRLVGSATRLPEGFEEALLGEIAVTLPRVRALVPEDWAMVYQDIVAQLRLRPAETDGGDTSDSSDERRGAVMMCDDYQI
jgi:hypothetical protein